MVEALVLDFGGVVTKTLFETHALTEQALGLAAGTLTWRGPFDPESDPEWRAMQAGEMTERDYWMLRTRETGQLIGEDWTMMSDLLQAARSGAVDDFLRPEALRAIDRWADRGRPVAILSNELDLFYGPRFRASLPFLDRITCIVDGTYTEILKPDPRAYELVCSALGLPPAACLMVDDQMRNIAGATKANMQTVWFDVTDPTAGFDRVISLLEGPHP
ncbi:MAG: HAD family hydrolase [Actinomycetia bacterium]|nr:HAD family hydrolase [Actinomycetes bacterium]MCP4960422.1 HAD family hydrolase [Actinomycetes bacterium]